MWLLEVTPDHRLSLRFDPCQKRPTFGETAFSTAQQHGFLLAVVAITGWVTGRVIRGGARCKIVARQIWLPFGHGERQLMLPDQLDEGNAVDQEIRHDRLVVWVGDLSSKGVHGSSFWMRRGRVMFLPLRVMTCATT